MVVVLTTVAPTALAVVAVINAIETSLQKDCPELGGFNFTIDL
jgi:hypothetical protein